MNNRKRFNWLSLLLYIVIFVVIIVIIVALFNNLNNPYNELYTTAAIDLVTDQTDNTYVYQYSSTQDGDSITITLVTVEAEKTTDETTGETSYTITSGNTYGYYTFEITELAAQSVTGYDEDGNLIEGTIYYFLNQDVAKVGGVGQIEVYTESTLLSWLPTIIYVAIVIIVIVFFFRILMSSAGSNKSAMDFNKSRARRVDDSKVKFADVAGCEEEKAEMAELIDYLKDPKRFTKNGAKLPKGILLVGPPGTGKTLLAKAVAGEAGVPFYSISGSDFVEMFVGVGAGRVRDLFKTAKQTAPCVVFIDEIDAVGRQRGAGMGGGNDEREQTLNQLLVELDGFEENSGVIVIAATNRDDVLDPALLRAGRFDRQITVNLPDLAGREAIFKVHARNKRFDSDIDFRQLARRTTGFSGADIANVLNEAAILAVRGKRDSISMADIDEAIDRRIAGIARSSRGISAKERKQIAYHEAGHAIIGLTLEYSDKVRKITIIPRGRTGGHVLMGPDEDRFLMTKNELIARIVGYLGGRSSEEIFFKDVSTGASNDIEVATRIARSMVVEYGMSSLGPIQYEKDSGSVFLGRDYTNTQRNFSLKVADEIDREVRNIIESAHQQALDIIEKRKDDVILIAETLLEHETINEEQIDYLLKNRKLPEEKVAQKDTALSSTNGHTEQKVEETKPTETVTTTTTEEVAEKPKTTRTKTTKTTDTVEEKPTETEKNQD